MSRQPLSNQHGRIAIVDGLRTPFARIATNYRDISAIDLGVMVVNEIIKRNDLKQPDIDQLIFGMTVLPPPVLNNHLRVRQTGEPVFI
jgi:acetyl-CoA acyltransferase